MAVVLGAAWTLSVCKSKTRRPRSNGIHLHQTALKPAKINLGRGFGARARWMGFDTAGNNRANEDGGVRATTAKYLKVNLT